MTARTENGSRVMDAGATGGVTFTGAMAVFVAVCGAVYFGLMALCGREVLRGLVRD